MIAIALLAAIIGVIVYSSRKARVDYVVSVEAKEPGQTWTFNVRDMVAERKEKASGKVVESRDLRRNADGGWETKTDDEAWTACDASAAEAIEAKHRSYNGDR